ncbi:MAG: DUF5615 family PIN-like protein [Granulosicoccus sp.]
MANVGIDAVHCAYVADPCAPDSLLASNVLANDLVVLTQDRDFGAVLAASGDSGSSVVQIRAGDTSPESIKQQVISALEQFSDEIKVGALITVDIDRSRVRLLPIRRWYQSGFTSNTWCFSIPRS